jgi:GTP-sensing pleiotropic transcriptional regulator CodY
MAEVSAEAEKIRSAIVETLRDEHGALSVKVIADKVGIELNRAKYNVLVLETERKLRRIDGAAGVYYEIAV